MTKKNVAVVGAGIAGITTAYYLARAGYEVTVYEQDRHPAMRTSFANGGQISVSNSETWNTWSNVWKGIRWMFTKDAPLLIRPRLDWAQWRWMARFLWHTIRGDYRQNTQRTIKLGLMARILYREICQEENINFDKTDCGILHIYKDAGYLAAAESVQRLYQSAGCDWYMLTPGQINNLDATTNGMSGIIGGAWTPTDSVGDIHKFCCEMEQVLINRYQVKFCYEDQIHSVDSLDEYDAVVVANGVGSVELAATAGDNLPIYPVKGYSITINNVDPTLLPRVSLLDDQTKIVTSTLGNRLRVAGTAELAGENYDITRDRIEPLLAWVHTNFPDINTHDYSQWACLRPMTPDMMPIVRQSDNNQRVFYNVGHGHLGWTVCPATAVQVVELINERIGMTIVPRNLNDR